ncbi:hypothetical protein BC938DRAFT_475750 [Jimgerdemannia flammicorona]|uniref:C2H2-type domain-containing protein n=1 Tax=Jimgerdemannia flammicorona TaxID=994334 RepID=A0A433PPI4_9FUNG|nr:hypothetical protein BC938DRAFT_475750 [Jimgerdemannia flammicorona]
MNSLQTTYTSDSLLAAYPSSSLVSNPNSNKRNFEDEVILSTSLNPLEQLTSIVEQQHAWAMLADGSPTKRRRTSPDPSRRPSLDNQHGILQRPSSPLEALVMALESFSPECDMTTEDFVKNETGDMSYSGQHAVHHSPGRRRSSASGERKVYACEFEGCGKQFMQLAHLRIHER